MYTRFTDTQNNDVKSDAQYTGGNHGHTAGTHSTDARGYREQLAAAVPAAAPTSP